MSEFSKKHLEVISQIRDRIDTDAEFRHQYLNNEMLHSAVEWFCSEPKIKQDPSTVWKEILSCVKHYISLKIDRKMSNDEWAKFGNGFAFKDIFEAHEKYFSDIDIDKMKSLGFTEEHYKVIKLIKDAIVYSDSFKRLYHDSIDFRTRIDYYCHTPGIKNAGTKYDPILKKLVIDMLMEVLKSHDSIKQFKALMKAIDVLHECENEDKEDWWI